MARFSALALRRRPVSRPAFARRPAYVPLHFYGVLRVLSPRSIAATSSLAPEPHRETILSASVNGTSRGCTRLRVDNVDGARKRRGD